MFLNSCFAACPVYISYIILLCLRDVSWVLCLLRLVSWYVGLFSWVSRWTVLALGACCLYKPGSLPKFLCPSELSTTGSHLPVPKVRWSLVSWSLGSVPLLLSFLTPLRILNSSISWSQQPMPLSHIQPFIACLWTADLAVCHSWLVHPVPVSRISLWCSPEIS